MAIQNYTLGRCDEKAPPDVSQIGPCRAPRPRVGAPSRPESRRYTPLVDTSDEFTEFRIVIRVRPFFSARSEGQERRAGRCGALCLMTYLKHHARISDGDCSPWRIVEALCASQRDKRRAFLFQLAFSFSMAECARLMLKRQFSALYC